MADLMTDAENAAFCALKDELRSRRRHLDIVDAYYNSQQKIQDLGISTPPQLRGLHVVLGWPRIAVDAIEERLDVEGFIYPGESDTDEELWDIWQANNLDEESALAHLDTLVFGHSFIVVGPGDDQPLITVESPRNMAVTYDARTRQITEALQLYGPCATQAVLYVPGSMVQLARETEHAKWQVVDRQENPAVFPPVVRMSNRQRVHDRCGNSEITQEVRNITDAACRTLLGLEISREFYAAPQRYLLGVDEEFFQNPDGTKKDFNSTYTGRLFTASRDEDGNVPTVGTFDSMNPGVYTDIVEMYAKIMVSQTGLPGQYLGIVTQNPASADAIRMEEQRLIKRAERKQRAFSGAWESVLRLALAVKYDSVPDDAKRIETLWRDAATPTLGAMADATVKFVQAQVLPPHSSVTLDRAGFTAAEQKRVQADWKRDEGANALAAITQQLTAPPAPQFQAPEPQ